MLVKIHKAYRVAVAICDSDLIGKKFEEGDRQLDLTGDFFKGEEKTKEEVKKLIEDTLKEDASYNLIGEESCNLAKECGLIKEGSILHIHGVPVALYLL